MEGVDYGESTKSQMERPTGHDFRQTLLPSRMIHRGNKTAAKWDADFIRPSGHSVNSGGDANQSAKSAVHSSRRRANLNQILAAKGGGSSD